MADETMTILRVDTGEAVRSVRDLRDNIAALKKEINEKRELGIGTSEYQTKLAELIKNQTALRNAMNGTKASLEDVENAAKGLGGSYNALVTQMANLRREQRNIDYSTEQGKKDYAELAVKISAVNDQLKEMDALNGNFQRHVGDYRGALNGLNLAMAQVVRELPSLAMSPNMFFMAISNNLPILADQIANLREQNRLSMEQGRKGVSVIGSLVKSLFSWNSVLVLVITALTLFGDELTAWVKSLFKGEEAAHDFAGAVDDINRALDTGDLGKQIADFERLARAYAEVGDSAEAKRAFIEEYRDEIDKTGIAVNNVNDADNLFITNSAAYIAALKARAQAQAGMTLASEQYGKAVEQQVKDEEKLAAAQARLEELQAKPEDYFEVQATSTLGYAVRFSRDELVARQEATIARIRQNTQDYIDAGDAYIDAANRLAEEAAGLLSGAGLDELSGDGGGGTELKEVRMRPVKLKLDIEPDIDLPDADDIQKELDGYMETLRSTYRKLAQDELADLDKETEMSTRKAALGAEYDWQAQDSAFAIEQESYDKRIELLKGFMEEAARTGDWSAYLDYQQEMYDAQDEMALRSAEYRTEVEKRQAKLREQAAWQSVDAASAILGSLADIYEENSEGNEQAARQAKNLRIASAVIDTISGAVSAYMGAIKAYSEIPGLGPVMGAIQAATVIAAGMAEVEKIRNTDVDKDSAPSASSSGMSAAVSAPVLPEEMPQTRILTSAEDEDRLNRMAYDQRVYVVYSDIAQAGRRVQVRDSEATF